MEREDVIGHLWSKGTRLEYEILKLREKHGLTDIVKLTGLYPFLRLEWNDGASATKDQIRTLFMTEMIQGGVLIIASNNLTFSHKDPEIKRIVSAYDRAFGAIAGGLQRGDIADSVGNSVVAAAPLRATT